MHAFRPTNELAHMDFSISPEGDVSWYTGTFSTDKKLRVGKLRGEHYAVPAVHACHLENNTCFAYMDGRRMVVYSCNQVPHTLRRNIAEAIGMPLGDVRVVKPFLGGGFGNKQDTMYEPLVALASQRLGGRCVAITLSRGRNILNTRTRHGFDMTVAAAADEAGDLAERPTASIPTAAPTRRTRMRWRPMQSPAIFRPTRPQPCRLESPPRSIPTCPLRRRCAGMESRS